ncbi:DNA (cytosine-5)-methyltransferase 1 [Leeuwenhoekiella aestuarii]|uniref:DNA (cytosine-5-)-methyltransferase n=1 Tax=Leeuwenhoekiella aestuarii TaxID=2249426 RepID=UPI000FFE93F6|nr:DNA (cytosine-5-)-methyltransferase [Leeuwenhoekiella aestuarii]RXG19124.1 DNA (cytosine-5)-methyltransferase 1 [Leeuwenhoekiella aestuarii]
MKNNIDIKFIDLFAGLGGIRLGLEQAAYDLGLTTKCMFTSEVKKSAIKALNLNFPNEQIEPTDITKIEAKEIEPFNILLGGFPCQAFSAAGKQRGFSETRGTLFFEIERILEFHLKNIDGFILENVEGLIGHDKKKPSDEIGRTLAVILNILRNKLGFNVEYEMLDASNFGVAQVRKRVFIVGCKKKYGKVDLKFDPKPKSIIKDSLLYNQPCLNNEFTKKLLRHYKPEELDGKFLKDKRGGKRNIHSWDFEYKGSVSSQQKVLLNLLFKQRRRRSWALEIGIDWMDGMPLTYKQIQTFYPNKNLQNILDDLVEKKYLVLEHPKKKVVNMISGRSYTERIPDETLPKGYNIVTGKLSFPISHILDSQNLAPTMVAMDMNACGVVDGDGIRRLSLKEGLRLFGYPESYSLDEFEKNEQSIKLGYDLLGNSVCVPVVRDVAKRLLTNIFK